MEFVLHYRGKLVPNGSPADKHSIRQWFHRQLKKLWTDNDSPLRYYPSHIARDSIQELGLFRFLPLVGDFVNLLAELEITLLRPQSPGSIVHSGDIDNRLKTLFDAMTIPPQQQALPPGAQPGEGENPFYCVFDDDRRITKLTILTERLWEAVTSEDEVELIILVRPVRNDLT